jgi:hypothetical protein
MTDFLMTFLFVLGVGAAVFVPFGVLLSRLSQGRTIHRHNGGAVAGRA